MKKLTLTCLMAVICFSLFGQTINVLKENVVKAQWAPYLTAGQLESADNHVYLYYTDNTVWSAAKPVNDVIYCVDKDALTVSEITIQHLNSYNFIDMYEDEDNLYVLYSEWQNKTKTYSLYLNAFEKNAKTAKWHPDEVLSVTTEKRDGLYLYHAVSPDKSMMAFTLLAASRKGDFKGSVVMTYGQHGEKLWENELNFDFANKTFSLLDFVLDNNGVTYSAVSSYTDVTRTSRSDESLQIVMVSADDSKVYEERIDFGYLSSSKMMVNRKGLVVLGGFYCDNLSNNEAGSYMVMIDPERGDISIDKTEFPSDYYAGKAAFGIPAPKSFATKAQYIEEYSDGTLLLLGEMRASVAYTDSRGMTTYRFYAKNIPVVYADASGKINDFAVIEKNQMASSGTNSPTIFLRGQGFSYVPVMYNDQVYIFYDDAVENYTGKSGMVSKPSYAPAHASVYCSIVPGQPIKTKAILNGKVSKYRLTIPILMDNGYVLGIGTNKKKMGDIVKINYDF